MSGERSPCKTCKMHRPGVKCRARDDCRDLAAYRAGTMPRYPGDGGPVTAAMRNAPVGCQKRPRADRERLSRILTDARKKAGISFKKVAAAVGLSRQSVQQHAAGIAWPRGDAIPRYSKLYGIPLEEMIENF